MDRNEGGIPARGGTRVVLATPEELLYWTGRFGVGVEELEEAIDLVGDDPAAIAAYLNIAR